MKKTTLILIIAILIIGCTKSSNEEVLQSVSSINIEGKWKNIGYYQDYSNPNPIPNMPDYFFPENNQNTYNFNSNNCTITNNLGQITVNSPYLITPDNILKIGTITFGKILSVSATRMYIKSDITSTSTNECDVYEKMIVPTNKIKG